MKYYYDDASGKDLVVIDSINNGYLELTNTSSGLQSVIPLLVLADFLVSHLKSQDDKSSVVDEQLKKKAVKAIYEKYSQQNDNVSSKQIVKDKHLAYLLVSLPKQNNTPFESFITTPAELIELRRKNIIFKGVNEARIKDMHLLLI